MKQLRKKILFFLSTGLILIAVILPGCKKEKKAEISKETGKVIDRQGNVYNTVKVGNQWWMCENLRVKVYNDSTPITEVTLDSNQVWADKDAGAFCGIDGRYDFYYNWFAVNSSKKIAPAGWHVATDEEWKILERELGMSREESDKTGWRGSDESKKLLPVASVGWPGGIHSLVYGTNEGGLSVLPGGCRLFNGTVGELASTSFFWSAAEKNVSTALYRNISNNNKTIFRYFADKHYGMNVRCVKD